MRKIIKTLWNALTWLFVIVFVLLAVALAGVRVLGYTPYAVMSPSMTPLYRVGDLVYTKTVKPENIQPGDVMTFVANKDLLVVTHRVVEADRDNRRFVTKGDANAVNDAAPVLYENVLGVAAFSLPKLGFLSMYISTTSGKYVAIGVGFCLLLLALLPELRTKKATKSTDPESAGEEITM